MPKQKDLKRLVRERARRTGEAYTTARQHVLRAHDDRRDLAGLAGMSDDAVHAKTGRNWRDWVAVLDESGATSKPHKEIARWLREEQGVAAWWAQTVTVAYERIRGLRDVGQRRGGGYDVNKSKTFAVPIETAYAAFSARKRRLWIGEIQCRVRTATRNKSIRFDWEGDTRVQVYFWQKGPSRCQVQLQHSDVPDKATADRLREEWGRRLTALALVLRGGDE
ncbi:MAG: DUF4287 domain-containing protein [bacterium]|nr:DUF4287 domain-containing protein [bacterium]